MTISFVTLEMGFDQHFVHRHRGTSIDESTDLVDKTALFFFCLLETKCKQISMRCDLNLAHKKKFEINVNYTAVQQKAINFEIAGADKGM